MPKYSISVSRLRFISIRCYSHTKLTWLKFIVSLFEYQLTMSIIPSSLLIQVTRYLIRVCIVYIITNDKKPYVKKKVFQNSVEESLQNPISPIRCGKSYGFCFRFIEVEREYIICRYTCERCTYCMYVNWEWFINVSIISIESS